MIASIYSFSLGLDAGAVENHLRKVEPKNSLVISFHGWAGVDKNFEARLVMAGKHVHLLISALHFPAPQAKGVALGEVSPQHPEEVLL